MKPVSDEHSVEFTADGRLVSVNESGTIMFEMSDGRWAHTSFSVIEELLKKQTEGHTSSA
jgi:hypothetical protein